MTLFARLHHPDNHLALAFENRTLTYRELASACRSYLGQLDDLGIHFGDRVAVWTQPSIETVVALVGNALAGVVSVPINTSIGERELEHVTRDASPVASFAMDPGTIQRTSEHAIHRIHIDSPDSGPAHFPSLQPDRAVLIVYTSGTTGAPKGAVITESNLDANLGAIIRAWAWTENDSLVHALPLFHVHGLVLGLFGTLRAGASMRWHAKFHPDAISAEFTGGANILFGVPTMYHRLAEASERDPSFGAPLRKARMLVSGSAPLPVREHLRIERFTGHRVIERYGLTETLINCAVHVEGDRRGGYVGPPLDGVDLRLVDDQRNLISIHDDTILGEIAVRGPSVFDGYLNRPDATNAVRDADGWFYTGDLAAIASDGYVRIVGRRATDLIKTGGFKVGAGEVEGALLEHAEVLEAAVIGVPDDDLGEKIVAFVVLRANSSASGAALIEHVANSLSSHKRPRAVHIVAELPRNAMGKVLKKQLQSVK